MIELWYTAFGATTLPPAVLAAHVARLPPAWQRRVLACRRPARQQATLFGALLLQHVLRCRAHPYALEHVLRTPDNRPYLAGAALDFNVSHSGRYAVCVLSTTCRVGVDIEERTRTRIAGFQPHFQPAEWAALHTADPQEQFYRLWTQKEAVAKADGRGLNIPLRDIRIRHQRANLAGTCWHVREIRLTEADAAAYTLHIAASQPEPIAAPRQVSFPELEVLPP
jgi:4'-phosphopantetheinyl transferase